MRGAKLHCCCTLPVRIVSQFPHKTVFICLNTFIMLDLTVDAFDAVSLYYYNIYCTRVM